MKKIYYLLTATLLLFLSCNKIAAQAPYKASVGGMPLVNTLGISSKFFLGNHIAFQTDLFWKVIFTGYKYENMDKKRILGALYASLELNPNIIYQKKIKEKTISELFWFIGGGVSFGYAIGNSGKFGANGIIGIEFVDKTIPVAFQIDFRPGYGMLFSFDKTPVYAFFFSHKSPWHHFDWLIGFTIRYTFKKKVDN